MENRFFSLQYKLILFSFAIIVIPILALGIFSYKESKEIVQQKVSISNLNTIRQIGERIEFIFQDAHDMSLFLIQNDVVREFFKLDNKDNGTGGQIVQLNEKLTYLLSSKPYIFSVYFKGFNGISTDTKNAANHIDEDAERKIIKLRGGYIWSTEKITQYDGSIANVFSMTRVLNDMNSTANKLAIMRINIDEDEFSDVYGSEMMDKEGYLFILDSDNRIISAANKEKLGIKLDVDIDGNIADNSKEGYFQTLMDGKNYLVTYYLIENLDYKIVNFAPLEEMLSENKVIKEAMIDVALLSFIVCLIFAFVFSDRVLRPLKKICIQMQKVEEEDFNVQVNFNGNDEIAMLGRSFNKMSKKLNELINQVYLTKIKQREAELAALQAQIKPHFLYNALDTIYWKGRMEKAFETSKLIKALAQLFRLSLNSGKNVICLDDEVEHLSNYLIIQGKRYGDSIDFNMEIEDGLLGCQVLKSILQPLVENAIIHGIDKKEGKGKIDVSIRKEDGILIYQIIDDGIGVNLDEINRFLNEVGDSNKGIGIKNVNDRIRLYFGEEYGITYYNGERGGTKVVVRQPYVEEGAGND